MLLRRGASVVLALLFTVLGYTALWAGGVPAARAATRSREVPDTALILLVLLGLVLLAIAMLTVVLSSLGAIVVGVLHLVAGIPITLAVQPAIALLGQSFSGNLVLASGVATFVPSGVAMLAGTTFLVGGLVSPRRVAKPGTRMRALAVIVALVGSLTGMLLALTGGQMIYSQYLQRLDFSFAPVPALMVIVGAVLFGVAVATIRWSSTGAIIVGAILAVLGIVALVGVQPLVSLLSGFPRELVPALVTAGAIGHLALLGVLLLTAGVAARLRVIRVDGAPAPV